MAPPPVRSQSATLHALTERLASHSMMNPFMGMPTGFPSALSSQAMAAAANAYRQPAPPPSLPNCPIYSPHQDTGLHEFKTGASVLGDGHLRCTYGRQWDAPTDHKAERSSEMKDAEMSQFVEDMGVVMRREYDCWIEQCWTEAFHHLFTRTLPTLIINLIMTGTTPAYLRRHIVHAGEVMRQVFQEEMSRMLYDELEMRLRGERPSITDAAWKGPPSPSLDDPDGTPSTLPTDVGVCFHTLLFHHDPETVEDDHGLCLCHLTTCLPCFTSFSKARKGAYSLLPYEMASTDAAKGWSGGIESKAQADARRASLAPKPSTSVSIPEGRGFVKNPKTAKPPTTSRPPPLFPHPQMTDVLAVEEHLRWRLKEMGASDPAVEARYGPCTNSPAATEGVNLPPLEPEFSIGESATPIIPSIPKGNKVVVNTRGIRRKMPPPKAAAPKSTVVAKKEKEKEKEKEKGKQCLLPKAWMDADPQERNLAIILTFRHFVKLLHQTTVASSPFAYPSYIIDIEHLKSVHPVALYRRLAEPGQLRQAQYPSDLRTWIDCMDKWGEEFAAKERTRGNKLVHERQWAEAIEAYSRGISLDPKKTILYSNRAISLNNTKQYSKAEQDCNHILNKDGKSSKAYFQRGVSRHGMGRYREALSDFKKSIEYNQETNNDSAKAYIERCNHEIGKLPKQSLKDVLDF